MGTAKKSMKTNAERQIPHNYTEQAGKLPHLSKNYMVVTIITKLALVMGLNYCFFTSALKNHLDS